MIYSFILLLSQVFENMLASDSIAQYNSGTEFIAYTDGIYGEEDKAYWF